MSIGLSGCCLAGSGIMVGSVRGGRRIGTEVGRVVDGSVERMERCSRKSCIVSKADGL